jgi:hypothetical protein
MSDKDSRYRYVFSIHKAGDLQSFSEIFNIIPRSTVATDLGVNYDRFTKKIINPELLTYKEVRKLSGLTNIDFKSLSDLVVKKIEDNNSPDGKTK